MMPVITKMDNELLFENIDGPGKLHLQMPCHFDRYHLKGWQIFNS